MINYFKAYLYKRTLPSTGQEIWFLSTRMQRAVSFAGNLIGGASYSEFTPGATTIKGGKTRTIWLNDMNNDLAEQYKKHAKGNVFYLGIPTDDSEQVQILTPSEYDSLNAEEDVFEQEQAQV